MEWSEASTASPEDARERLFAAAPASASGIDLSIRIGDLTLANPVMPASGCFGPEMAPLAPLGELGATVTKTVFAQERGGNPTHRLSETPFGMINSVGIPSPGTKVFLERTLPRYRALGAPTIVSIGGLRIGEYFTIMDELADAAYEAVEVNVSCPNLEAGGAEIGTSPESIATIVSGTAERTEVPILVKLTPMVSSIAEVARAAEEAGATAVTVANSFPGIALDGDHRALLGNVVGGVSGPSIKPLALRLVWEAAKAVRIPIIGCGGISNADDVLDFLTLGATAVQVGTATFARPHVLVEIIRTLAERCVQAGVASLMDLVTVSREGQ